MAPALEGSLAAQLEVAGVPLVGALNDEPYSRQIFAPLPGLREQLLSLARALLPEKVLSTEVIGQAMLSIARHGATQPVLDSAQIYHVALREKPAPNGG